MESAIILIPNNKRIENAIQWSQAAITCAKSEAVYHPAAKKEDCIRANESMILAFPAALAETRVNPPARETAKVSNERVAAIKKNSI